MMGSIKDRNDLDLTEAEDVKRWQEYMEELYKKDLHDPDNHGDVITNLEPDILECEVKWALESIYIYFLFFGCGIWDLSSPTRIKPVPPALEVWSLNHWTSSNGTGILY